MVLDSVAHAVHDALLAVLGRVQLHLRLDVLCGHGNTDLDGTALPIDPKPPLDSLGTARAEDKRRDTHQTTADDGLDRVPE